MNYTTITVTSIPILIIKRRLVPTSADVWAEYQNNKPVITEVRMKSGAEACGITAGMEIVAINDILLQML